MQEDNIKVRACSRRVDDMIVMENLFVSDARLSGDSGVSRLEFSEEPNWKVRCPYGDCEYGTAGKPHSVGTTNMHIAIAHKQQFEVDGIPKKPEMRVMFSSGEECVYFQCGICGCFTTERYTRHYSEHFKKDVNSKIHFGSIPLTFALNNRKGNAMNLVNLDCFFREYFATTLSAVRNIFRDSNVPGDLKSSFAFNAAGVEKCEGATRYYIFIDPIKKIGYIGSTKQFWRVRRNKYYNNVHELAFGDGTVFTIIGYVDKQRHVTQWGSKKEIIEFFMLNVLAGRNGYVFLNGRYNINYR